MVTRKPRLILITFFLSIVGLGVALAGQTPSDMDKAFEKLKASSAAFAAGLKDFEAGRTDKAEAGFSSCLAKFPEHAYARYYLANILYGRGEFPAALKQMELSVNRLDLMKALGERADQLKAEKLGDVQRSLDAMWESAARSEQPCRNRRSIEFDKREAQDESLKAETAAAERAAAFTRIKAHYTYFMGNILFRLQRVPEAFRSYEEAVRLDPRHADAYNNLVAICFVANQYAAAQAFLARAEGQGLDESLNLELKGKLFKALGRHTEGILAEDIAAGPGDALRARRFALAYQPEPAGGASRLYVNAYVVYSPQTADAILVDPGVKDERIEAFVRDRGLRVRAIFNTHGHPDHTGANRMSSDLFQVPVHAFEGADAGAAVPDRRLKDGDLLPFGGLEVRVLHTPGHTRGSLCYLVGPILLSGDTLFRGDIGRVEAPSGAGGDEALTAMVKVIRAKLLTLPDETVVCPGHGRTTTIGNEKTRNPLLAR